jgi:uncharacterized protein YggE
MFKRVVLVVAVIALLVPIGLVGVWIWGQADRPVEAQTSTPAEKPVYNSAQTITVLGQGSVKIKPDIAQISIGVETSAETVSDAVKQNETQMQAILAALKQAGIPEKDIRTTNYSVYFDRNPQPVPSTEAAASESKPQYRVSNMVNVTVRTLDTVGDVLDAVIEAGANNIWGVTFSLEDPKLAQADARTKAIADAKSRAEALAELTGITLGPVMSVSEVIGSGTYPMPALSVSDRAAGGVESISPGELEVTYQVQVAYFITP